MKILITGANGMLANAVKEELKGNELICTDVAQLDITDEDAVNKYVGDVKPDYIINCAAYTAVDKAEENEQLVYKINAIGPKNLAVAAKTNDAVLVHISTDYVFGGERDVAEDYSEDDEKILKQFMEQLNLLEKNLSKKTVKNIIYLEQHGYMEKDITLLEQ